LREAIPDGGKANRRVKQARNRRNAGNSVASRAAGEKESKKESRRKSDAHEVIDNSKNAREAFIGLVAAYRFTFVRTKD